MTTHMTRRAFLGLTAATGLAVLGGCAGGGTASSNASSGNAVSTGASASALTIGTLATEDLLPLWVAQEEGLFAETGLAAEIATFQSATELIAGVASGEVDLAMTDIMVTASMFASGIDVQMQWVTLGATADQGRFGIMVGPESPARTLQDLASIPIGVGSNTILEYVMDRLMENAGIGADQIIVEELQKLPVRYQAMVAGDVEAAALPGTLLALGEVSGCRLIADDTQGDNISQSVMIARADFLASADGPAQVETLSAVWDAAAGLVNASPEEYRAVLVANANLPEEIADTYPISTYPTAALPADAMVAPVLEWMQQKGYLSQPLSYDEQTGAFSAA